MLFGLLVPTEFHELYIAACSTKGSSEIVQLPQQQPRSPGGKVPLALS